MATPTRILYLTPGCFDKGGISRYNRYQVSALRQILSTHDVRVLSVLGPTSESFEVPFETAFFAGGTSPTRKARYVWCAARSALLWRPRIVLAAHVNLAALGGTLASAVRATSVLNVYGSEVWSRMRADARWGLRHADHVVADCHFTARYVEQAGHRRAQSTSVVWDCVDVGRFSPGAVDASVLRRYGIPDPATGFNVLTLGRMSANDTHKGYERLLDAFAVVIGQVPSARLIYAGRGALVDVLRDRVHARGLADRVFFTGAIHERDLAEVYRSGHLFSLVSDRGSGRGEGIPLTPLEASACGVPIMVGNQDGSQEAIVDGRNGWVVDPFDLGTQVRRIVELARDAALHHRMSHGAADVARTVFSYERFRREHEVLLANWM